jgi:hypothetical protein
MQNTKRVKRVDINQPSLELSNDSRSTPPPFLPRSFPSDRARNAVRHNFQRIESDPTGWSIHGCDRCDVLGP